MKNLLQITSAGEDLLGTVDDGTNRLFINDTEIASSAWTGTGSYTGSFSGHTITIAKIADTSGNVAIRKTGTFTYELYDQKSLEYLPLTGGTLTGDLYMPNGYGNGIGGGYSKFVTRSEIGAGSSNDLLFTIPHLSYSTIGATDTFDSNVAQKWLKYVTTNFGSKLGTDRIIVNELTAGVHHVIIGAAYDWTDIVDGMPRYSWFHVFSYRFENYTFGTTAGSFVMTSQRFDTLFRTPTFSKVFTVSANSTVTLKASDYITIPSGYTCLGVTEWSTNCGSVIPRSIRPFTGNYDFELQNVSSSSQTGTWWVKLLCVRTMFT